MTVYYHDLFAGPGGWDVAADGLGWVGVGFELDGPACETRRANGHTTVQGDVSQLSVAQVFSADILAALPEWRRALIASPPCPTFSAAGKGEGRKLLPALAEVAWLMAQGEPLARFRGTLGDDPRTELVLEPLRWALEAIELVHPYDFIALEQVPSVLPLWQVYAEVLREQGYSVAVGNLQAEQFGVPQTRKRAVLLARRDGVEARLPTPTHSRFHVRDRARLDPGVLPWVSMAEALGWGLTARPSGTLTGGGTGTGGAEPFGSGMRRAMSDAEEAGEYMVRSNYGTGGDPAARGARSSSSPAATITSKAGRNQVVQVSGQTVAGGDRAQRGEDEPSVTMTGRADLNRLQYVASRQSNATVRDSDEPAPTVIGGHDPEAQRLRLRNGNQAHSAERDEAEPAATIHFGARLNAVTFRLEDADLPAPSVNGDPRISPRGCKHPAPGCCSAYPGTPQRQHARSRPITVAEAAALQTFPDDHPWQGTKTQQFQQVGNAVPPLLAKHLLTALTEGAPQC